ncbi:MAG TPA: hypothetical protein DIT65_00680 [Cryomorphaceae bacterium]|nr:hypothetical protein [Cryomorphaceae bacterium]
MTRSRFYALFLTFFFTGVSYSQPYWQKGTRLATISSNANLDGLESGFTNAGINTSAGGALFLDEKWAIGVDGKYRWAPLSQSIEASVRFQNLVYGASNSGHSLLLDIHLTAGNNMNITLSGDMFGRRTTAIGLGAQYTYWLSSSVGIYLWPQVNRTNSGPSGLWDWQMITPVGLQLSWQ